MENGWIRLAAPWLSALAAAWLAGCVSHSTAADRSAVSELVEQRTHLALPPAGDHEARAPELAQLLSKPLSVDDAIHVALLNNRELAAALLELGVARGALVQANVFPNPDFEASVELPQRKSLDPIWSLGASVDLTEIVLRGARKDLAQAELGAARIRTAGDTLDLAYRVRLAYYETLAAEQQLELQRTALAAFQASFDAASALHAAGNITTLDLVSEQTAYEGARDAVSAAEIMLTERREALSVLLGLGHGPSGLVLIGRLEPPTSDPGDADALQERALAASLELASARATLMASARRLDLVEAEGVIPRLSVGVSAEHDIDGWAVGPAVQGNLPVFDRQQGLAVSARAELDALRERYVADAVQIRSAVRALHEHARAAAERAKRYHDTLLPLHERVVHETVLQHNAMQASVFQLLQARREQLAAAGTYLDTLLEYWRARAGLDQLLAGKLVEP
ncbi:MAG TPA: TolC family protein [Polyangiales bacterium]|nr:TolC family protein [Polyangiales bacterium]